MIRASSSEYRIVETRHPARGVIALHRHAAPYVALVLEGTFEELSVDGAWVCEPGDLVVHPAWHLHANRFRDSHCVVLNFHHAAAGAPDMAASARVVRTRDPRALLARRRVGADDVAGALARGEPLAPRKRPAALERFAAALGGGPERRVAVLASGMGCSREHLARTFRSWFGLSPRQFRAEERLRRALELIAAPEVTLATAAYETGYSDQAHLTRCVRAATRLTPGQLRRRTSRGQDITFVQ